MRHFAYPPLAGAEILLLLVGAVQSASGHPQQVIQPQQATSDLAIGREVSGFRPLYETNGGPRS